MKKILALFICSVFVVLCLAGCSGKKAEPEKTEADSTASETVEATSLDVTEPEQTSDKTILVAYFSRTGNTEKLAHYAAEYYNADIFEIEAKIPYTDDDINYNNSDSRTSKEQNDSAARPEIADMIEDMDKYDTIILAYPIWWGQAPRIIDTFIESYYFSGKKIIPFCTSASSDIGSSDDALHELAKGEVTWAEGKRFAASTDKDTLTQWLDSVM